jgi:hypothetical protein
MSANIYPLRLSAEERRIFKRSATAEGKKLSEWLRAAAHERIKTNNVRQRAACLDYPDKIELDIEAEKDPKSFIERQLAAKSELYR